MRVIGLIVLTFVTRLAMSQSNDLHFAAEFPIASTNTFVLSAFDDAAYSNRQAVLLVSTNALRWETLATNTLQWGVVYRRTNSFGQLDGWVTNLNLSSVLFYDYGYRTNSARFYRVKLGD